MPYNLQIRAVSFFQMRRVMKETNSKKKLKKGLTVENLPEHVISSVLILTHFD